MKGLVTAGLVLVLCHVPSIRHAAAFMAPARAGAAIIRGRAFSSAFCRRGAHPPCRHLTTRRCLVSAAMSLDEWEGMVDRVIGDLNSGVNKYVFVREVDDETAAELRAAVLVAGRGYKRRNRPAESAPAPSLQQVMDELQSMVKGAVVEREQLISEDEWDKIVRGFGQASKVVNDEGEARPDVAPPLTLDGVIQQLERMFPNASPGELEEAARRGVTLEAATDLIMTSSISLTRLSAQRTILPRGSPRRGVSPAPPEGGEGFLETMPVNGGASAFGLYLDLTATQYAIRVSGILAASSAGLNMGDKRPIAVKVSMRPAGTGRGFEMDSSEWQLIGSDDALALNIASWFDESPTYTPLPLDHPIDLSPGQTVGLCIHSSDVNGIAIRMAQNQAAIDTDMADEDFGGGVEDDEVGVLRNSYSPGAITTEDACLQVRCGYTACSPSLATPPVSQPVPAAFVGALTYQRLHDPNTVTLDRLA